MNGSNFSSNKPRRRIILILAVALTTLAILVTGGLAYFFTLTHADSQACTADSPYGFTPQQAQYMQYILGEAAKSHVIQRVFRFAINYGNQSDNIYPPSGIASFLYAPEDSAAATRVEVGTELNPYFTSLDRLSQSSYSDNR